MTKPIERHGVVLAACCGCYEHGIELNFSHSAKCKKSHAEMIGMLVGWSAVCRLVVWYCCSGMGGFVVR